MLNAIGSVAILAICVAIGVSEIGEVASLSPPRMDDPDRDKGLALHVIAIGVCALLGAIAFVSLARTVKRWRERHEG
jgi:hypothetical protein